MAQNAPDRALIVNGKSAGMVVQMGGHAYVDVETVAQFTNGSVTLEPTSSRAYLSSIGIQHSSEHWTSRHCRQRPRLACPEILRVWPSLNWRRCASGGEPSATILTYGVPVVGTWPQDYHDRVEANLEQVGGSRVNRRRLRTRCNSCRTSFQISRGGPATSWRRASP